MKKTIIAAAIATVVAAPAMADVKISGKVEQTITDADDADWSSSTADSFIKFAASEDLGNGMTAVAHVVLDIDEMNSNTDDADEPTDIGDIVVGLNGGFGTVLMGSVEDFTEGHVMSMMTVMKGNDSIETDNLGHGRTDGGLAYVSPSFNGLTVGVAGYSAGGTTYGNMAATDVMVAYSNGPLTLKASVEDSDINTEKLTSFGVQYKAGALDLRGTMQTQDDDTAANKDLTNTAIAAVYTMGNNSIAIGWNEEETGTTSITSTNTSQLELRHAFSARTSAYIGAVDNDTAADKTYVGLEHSF